MTLDLRARIVGLDRAVPLLDGRRVPYVNLDNAASTPALVDVARAVDEFMPFYSSVHRGTGFKSRLSTCLLYTSPSPQDRTRSRMPSSA